MISPRTRCFDFGGPSVLLSKELILCCANAAFEVLEVCASLEISARCTVAPECCMLTSSRVESSRVGSQMQSREQRNKRKEVRQGVKRCLVYFVNTVIFGTAAARPVCHSAVGCIRIPAKRDLKPAVDLFCCSVGLARVPAQTKRKENKTRHKRIREPQRPNSMTASGWHLRRRLQLCRPGTDSSSGHGRTQKEPEPREPRKPRAERN